MNSLRRTSILLMSGGLLLSCSSPPPAPPSVFTSGATTHSGHEVHALHNVHPLDDRIISGAVPEGEAAFDELAAMGVKTVISVDGAAPDVERAAARGLRYVHIPITYAEVSDEERLEIARAVRDLPGPVYIHCHHGKHRSPAAAAAIGIALGRVTPEQGLAFMKTCGTAPNYTGLYTCVAAGVPAAAAALDAAPAEFPAVRTPEGIVAAMVGIDLAFEHLGDIRAAGWKVPPTHPDLIPAAEAGRLVDLLRVSIEDPRARAHGGEYATQNHAAVAVATALEDALVANAPPEKLEAHFKLVEASCKDCHASYRNKK